MNSDRSIIVITGGAKSGKSAYAIAMSRVRSKKAFIATAIAFDDEMKRRIERHKRQRDPSFFLIEEPYDVAMALRKAPQGTELILVDCLTVWLGNLLYRNSNRGEDFPEVKAFVTALSDPPCDLILVTNEVGLGIVPDNEQARAYRDLLGALNQKIARRAQQVIFMISGIPLIVKNQSGDEHE